MNAKTVSGILILLIAAGTLATVLVLLNKAARRAGSTNRNQLIFRTGILFVAWIALLGLLAATGMFTTATVPPRPIFTAVAGILILFNLSYTNGLKNILLATPLHWLLFFQS